jgi:hypothetical protein
MRPPPAILDGAKVLEYAMIDSSVQFTGRLHLYHGDTRIGAVPCLAIGQNPDMNELLLFHCDEDWNVLGAQIWNTPGQPVVTSVEEVKARAENYYAGVSTKWVRNNDA